MVFKRRRGKAVGGQHVSGIRYIIEKAHGHSFLVVFRSPLTPSMHAIQQFLMIHTPLILGSVAGWIDPL